MSFIRNLLQGVVVTACAGAASVIGAEGARQFLENVKNKKKKKIKEINTEGHPDESEDGGEAIAEDRD